MVLQQNELQVTSRNSRKSFVEQWSYSDSSLLVNQLRVHILDVGLENVIVTSDYHGKTKTSSMSMELLDELCFRIKPGKPRTVEALCSFPIFIPQQTKISIPHGDDTMDFFMKGVWPYSPIEHISIQVKDLESDKDSFNHKYYYAIYFEH